MAVTLDAPISWKNLTAHDAVMLDNLQPNIIKPHVRDVLTILFLNFTDPDSGRAFLGQISSLMKSAKRHLEEIEGYKNDKKPGSSYIGVGLSKVGYEALQIAQMPADASFQAGMHTNSGLNDPATDSWDIGLQQPGNLHAVVLVGDAIPVARDATLAKVRTIIAATGTLVVSEQEGLGRHNSDGQGIEHFGYVDGRSQPLFLREDIDNERDNEGGISNWNPSSPLDQVIVPDPAAPDPSVHFGSYFIYRKLEQDVKKFKKAERQFARYLALNNAERAGALLVGRFENGTPVTLQGQEGPGAPVLNNFNYTGDEQGAKCPFLGHIRKTNPRGSGGFEALQDEHRHLMARRGQTYGVRSDDPNDGEIENKPEKDVGLLFMAFNSDIGNQFDFTQIAWANNSGFPSVPDGTKAPGVDPLIGQTPGDVPRPDMTVATRWGDPTSMKTVAPVPRTVTMKGGEYFFMPSLAFLRSFTGAV